MGRHQISNQHACADRTGSISIYARVSRAFTIIELLVVIGVITLLVAILLPMIGRSREVANRVQCAANLRNLGAAAHLFASRNNGWFPMSYRLPSGSYPYRWPNVISRDDRLAATAAQWQTYGSPFKQFELVGATEATWTCPSSNSPPRTVATAQGLPAEWGPKIFWTNYIYVAGMTSNNRGRSTPRWGRAAPAVKNRDPKQATLLLAADLVFYSGGEGMDWDKTRRYYINHQRYDMPGLPDFQNILYADGHVEGQGRSYYGDKPLNTTDNFSLQHSPAPAGGFFYWGPAQSAVVSNPIVYTAVVPKTGPPVAPKPAPTTPTPPPPPPPPTTPAPPPDTPDVIPGA
jgi:competence protein ComGC